MREELSGGATTSNITTYRMNTFDTNGESGEEEGERFEKIHGGSLFRKSVRKKCATIKIYRKVSDSIRERQRSFLKYV